jgi:hypothetical protein
VFAILDNPTANHGAGSNDWGEGLAILWNRSGGWEGSHAIPRLSVSDHDEIEAGLPLLVQNLDQKAIFVGNTICSLGEVEHWSCRAPILVNTTHGVFYSHVKRLFALQPRRFTSQFRQLRQIFIKNITLKFHFGRQRSSLVAVSKACRGLDSMKMLAEYLEKAIAFERMAADEKDAKLKADLEKQAAAYRKLAGQRAKQYKFDLPPQSMQSNWEFTCRSYCGVRDPNISRHY